METPMRKSMMNKSRPIVFSEFGWILPNNKFETRNLIKVTSQTRKAIDDVGKNYILAILMLWRVGWSVSLTSNAIWTPK